VTVFANDTDILVLLLYHFDISMANISLRSDSKTGFISIVSIRDVYEHIENTAARLPVIHAIGGCDTTSAMYGRTKVAIWRSITKNNTTISLTDILGCEGASHQDIEKAGLQLVSLIYGGQNSDTLNKMRFKSYMSMLSRGTRQPQPERLPPTEAACKFHVYHVHLQVVQWKSLMRSPINPEQWGWQIKNGRYIPIATDVAAAPADMLRIICCKCQVNSGRPCRTQLCSCVKHGLACVTACKHCSGDLCRNSEPDVVGQDQDDSANAYHALQLSNEEVPADCMEFYVPWIDEEIVECDS